MNPPVSKPRILLFGRDGQVGQELLRTLPALGEVTALGRGDADLADAPRLRSVARAARPDVIVNAAAFTAVDRAEEEIDLAMAVNGAAPTVLAEEAREMGALLVHYSTDYVFDGEARRPYVEEDPPRPINVYGASKLEGEAGIQREGDRFLILRTGWVYGWHGRNFLLTILRLASERDEIHVVDDQIGTPTSSRYLARATAEIVSAWWSRREADRRSGLYHLSPSGQTSWYGFARRILEETDQSTRVHLRATATQDLDGKARRPRFSVLSSARLEREWGIRPPPFEHELAEICKPVGEKASWR